MKKQLASILTALALCLSPLSVLAADSPSPDSSINGELVDAPDAPKDAELIITPVDKITDETPDEISGPLLEAKDEIEQAIKDGTLSTLLPGAPANATVEYLFDASLAVNGEIIPSGQTGTVTMTLDVALKEGQFLVFHRNGKWVLVTPDDYKDGKLTITVDSLSPFAIVTWTESKPGEPGKPEPGKPSTDNGSTSTGKVETAAQTNVALYAVTLCVASAGAVLFAKARKDAE